MKVQICFCLARLPTGDPVPVSPLFAHFGQLCIPSNDRLLDYWSTLEGRLIRAAAAGVSISDAVNGLSAQLPPYRFAYMQVKAMEFTADVRALGTSLLAALEKQDAEALANCAVTTKPS